MPIKKSHKSLVHLTTQMLIICATALAIQVPCDAEGQIAPTTIEDELAKQIRRNLFPPKQVDPVRPTIIEITVKPDGELVGRKMIKSSGHTRVDKSAMCALEQVKLSEQILETAHLPMIYVVTMDPYSATEFRQMVKVVAKKKIVTKSQSAQHPN